MGLAHVQYALPPVAVLPRPCRCYRIKRVVEPRPLAVYRLFRLGPYARQFLKGEGMVAHWLGVRPPVIPFQPYDGGVRHGLERLPLS